MAKQILSESIHGISFEMLATACGSVKKELFVFSRELAKCAASRRSIHPRLLAVVKSWGLLCPGRSLEMFQAWLEKPQGTVVSPEQILDGDGGWVLVCGVRFLEPGGPTTGVDEHWGYA